MTRYRTKYRKNYYRIDYLIDSARALRLRMKIEIFIIGKHVERSWSDD